MAGWHVKMDKDGAPNGVAKCSATERACPNGGFHSEDKAEVEQEYNRQMEESHGQLVVLSKSVEGVPLTDPSLTKNANPRSSKAPLLPRPEGISGKAWTQIPAEDRRNTDTATSRRLQKIAMAESGQRYSIIQSNDGKWRRSAVSDNYLLERQRQEADKRHTELRRQGYTLEHEEVQQVIGELQRVAARKAKLDQEVLEAKDQYRPYLKEREQHRKASNNTAKPTTKKKSQSKKGKPPRGISQEAWDRIPAEDQDGSDEALGRRLSKITMVDTGRKYTLTKRDDGQWGKSLVSENVILEEKLFDLQRQKDQAMSMTGRARADEYNRINKERSETKAKIRAIEKEVQQANYEYGLFLKELDERDKK